MATGPICLKVGLKELQKHIMYQNIKKENVLNAHYPSTYSPSSLFAIRKLGFSCKYNSCVVVYKTNH